MGLHVRLQEGGHATCAKLLRYLFGLPVIRLPIFWGGTLGRHSGGVSLVCIVVLWGLEWGPSIRGKDQMNMYTIAPGSINGRPCMV